MKISQLIMLMSAVLAGGPIRAEADDRKNWICGGEREWAGVFERTEEVVNPWTGVDAGGYLRKAVALPSCYPFITKSNQFTYAWLGTSASFIDLDSDGLPDLVSPDGNGMFWFWKNTGTPGKPAFGAGEVMPLLVDDLRSTFSPIFGDGQTANPKEESKGLTSSQQAEKKRVDERRQREFDRLKRKNDRASKDKRRNEKDLRMEADAMFPYSWEQPADEEQKDTDPTPAGRILPGAKIPPGGLSCNLNSFRRLRLVACPIDWNADGAPDFLAGDSGGTVYLAPNTGKPGAPAFGWSNRATHALPLRVVRIPGEDGKPARSEVVSFLNYAMPFACDWDANGVPDLLLGEGTYSVNTVRLFPDVARATAQTPPREIALYVGEDRTFLAPFAYDWDGDGDLDLFVNDDAGRLTAHRREGASISEPVNLTLDGGNAPLAYCTPQPCDWNVDGTMDLLWGDPFGRIMVALGKEKGGTAFSAPEAVRSTITAETVAMPASGGQGRTMSLAAVPVRAKDEYGGWRGGGTADARRFYRPDGTRAENAGGWPGVDNNPFYGLMPSWPAVPPPGLEVQLDGDEAGRANGKSVSWGIAPYPGDIWEVIEESGVPGRGRTLLLRWHDTRRDALFKTATVPPPQWTPGVGIHFDSGVNGPFGSNFTKKPITVKFHMKLDGEFSRMDANWGTTWGPLVKGKPPAQGGSFSFSMSPLPRGQWFEVTHTEEPHDEFERGLCGSLTIMLLGKGEVRLRDVRVFEGN
ncbi:MAG: hypothetical protein Fur0032_05950 [Terrimicrobiaceae bacterium]